MNPNQTISTIARVAPPLLFAVLAGVAIKSFFSSEKKKPETAPASAPKNVPVIPPISALLAPKIPASVPISKDLSRSTTPQRRRIVMHEDLAQIFQEGTRALYRKDAVAEL